MPKTKFQDLTFTVIMVLIFVYVMTFYNAGMENGVTFSTFGYALKNMWGGSNRSLYCPEVHCF